MFFSAIINLTQSAFLTGSSVSSMNTCGLVSRKSLQQGQSRPSDMFCFQQKRKKEKIKERKRRRARESKLQRLQVFHIT